MQTSKVFAKMSPPRLSSLLPLITLVPSISRPNLFSGD